MSGEHHKKQSNITPIFVFIIVVILAGTFFFYLRLVPYQYSFISKTPAYTNSESEITVLVAGDIMLDRNVRNKINAVGFDNFFKGVKDLVSKADIAVANLEGPFTSNPSKTADLKNQELVFTFDPALAPKLADLGFYVLGLANNHSLNFGASGLQETKNYIHKAGMLYYGDPNNQFELSTIVEKKGISLGFVGFHEFSYRNYENVLAEIDRLRPEVDVLIVSPHWGVEYQAEPTTLMQKWARLFIDHGADAVIGAHPHIIGDIEEYNGKKIYYSLGNFAFDQYFSEETMKGLTVQMDITKKADNTINIEFKNILVSVDKEGVKTY